MNIHEEEKVIKPIIDSIIAKKNKVGSASTEIKKVKAQQLQELKDSGLYRALREPKDEQARGVEIHKAQKEAYNTIADIPVPVSKDTSILEDITEKLVPIKAAPNKIAVAVSEAKQALIEKVKAIEIKQEVAIIAAEEATELIEAAVLSVDDIIDNHKDWIDAYEEKSGKKAIWQGKITEGFKNYIEENGFR